MSKEFYVQLNQEVISQQRSGELILTIEEGIQQIEIQLELPGKQWCHLTLHDSNSCRGQLLLTHQHQKVIARVGVDVATTSATMIAGAITPGQWRLTYEVEGDEPEQNQLKLSLIQHGQAQQVEAENVQDVMLKPPRNNKNGWLKGDFHTHTIYSDGKMTRENNLKSAQAQQLDFFVATDHQVVTHQWPETEIAVYAGVEITTNVGHANFLGVERLLVEDYHIDQLRNPASILELINTNQNNGLFSVNHPFLAPWEWQLDELPLALVDSIEICNDPTYGDNTLATEKALQLWSVLWQNGWKITGVGGSDSHLLPTETYPDSQLPSLIGDPATYVYVSSLNRKNLLKAVKQGKTIISRTSRLELRETHLGEILPGQQLKSLQGQFEIALVDQSQVQFEWILDGQVVQRDQGSSAQFDFNFPPATYHWLRVDVRDLTGQFLATFTPVYWHEQEPTFVTWKEARDELSS